MKRGRAISSIEEKEQWLLDHKERWQYYEQLDFNRQRGLRKTLFKQMRDCGLYSKGSTATDGSVSLFPILKRLVASL